MTLGLPKAAPSAIDTEDIILEGGLGVHLPGVVQPVTANQDAIGGNASPVVVALPSSVFRRAPPAPISASAPLTTEKLPGKLVRGSSSLSRPSVITDDTTPPDSEDDACSGGSTTPLASSIVHMGIPGAGGMGDSGAGMPHLTPTFYSNAALQMLHEKARIESSVSELLGHLQKLMSGACMIPDEACEEGVLMLKERR